MYTYVQPGVHVRRVRSLARTGSAQVEDSLPSNLPSKKTPNSMNFKHESVVPQLQLEPAGAGAGATTSSARERRRTRGPYRIVLPGCIRILRCTVHTAVCNGYTACRSTRTKFYIEYIRIPYTTYVGKVLGSALECMAAGGSTRPRALHRAWHAGNNLAASSLLPS